jgi:glycogen phosphorylase
MSLCRIPGPKEMSNSTHLLEVRPRLPEELKRLTDLSGNLLYSWERQVRGLFYRMDPQLWNACRHNPGVFLRRISGQRLQILATDPDFLLKYREVVSAFDNYLDGDIPREGLATSELEAAGGPVAYFCMEYGLHESLQLYSGGLGILAGDHCKAASDLGLPFVAVGLMYRQGFFDQTIDRQGNQRMHQQVFSLDDLPIRPVLDADGEVVKIEVPFPKRQVTVRVWRAEVGRIPLLLLDTDVEDNAPEDRIITHQLYGGDRRMRIAQELVLGVGGVRALRALDLSPSVWHLNEGHPAFLILERCRELIAEGLEFGAALEAIAAANVFTTHTAVPAGHDLFDHSLATEYLQPLAAGLEVPVSRLLELGESPHNAGRFNMTALALRGARRYNAVSAVHREVAADMESHVWPQIDVRENPITHVSNGVHIPTFLAREWVTLLDDRYPDWRRHQDDADFWDRVVATIPDHRFWALTQSLKGEMLEELRRWLLPQYKRNRYGCRRIDDMLETISPENTRPLVIGFARRFATYKRALLLFQDIERLGRLLNDPDRPVVLLFAGKAHPHDEPGQDLIRQLHELASRPPCLGRLFLIEGYDMALARKLVTGVDLWLNTPEYPLEASGTSGQKAAINGVVNLSVLDGWWAEGYDGSNGWAITPQPDLPAQERDHCEAMDLLDLLEYEVIPTYFASGPGGYSPDWVAHCKRSMASVLPRFSAGRMVSTYTRTLYLPAAAQSVELCADDWAAARELAEWKAKVQRLWPSFQLSWGTTPPSSVCHGDKLDLAVDVTLNGLSSADLEVECLLTPTEAGSGLQSVQSHLLQPDSATGNGRYTARLAPADCGLFKLEVRAYPRHRLLAHRFETGLMSWLRP